MGVMCSCSNSEKKVELEIISNRIFFSKNETKSKKNIIEYKITNTTDCNYYFNGYSLSKLTWKIKGLQPSNVFFQILDEQKKLAESDQKEYLPTENISICRDIYYNLEKQELENLDYSISPDYKKFMDKNNFLLPKGESRYFEILYYFPNSNYSYVNLKKDKKYNFKIIMYSDSTNYKKILSREMLKNLKENNYRVYHGIIESKNTIPVEVID